MFAKKKSLQKTDTAIGLDIGNFSVKIVQIARKESDFQLLSFGYSPISVGKIDGIPEAIKTACAQANLEHKKVNASINSESAIVRYLVLPQMSEEDLKGAMEFEIDRYIPFEKKDIISDYMVLTKESGAKNMKVLLVAAKKSDLEKRLKILVAAGLEPEVITIDSIVLRNSFQLNYPDKSQKTVGLINIGSKVTNINIVKDFASYFMRDVQLGGDNITHLLKEKLEVEIGEAEKIKSQMAIDDKEKFKIIEPVLGNLLNEIYLSFDYYESEFGIAVNEIFISGGTAPLTWLAEFLKENLNREITILNPIQHLTLGPSVLKEQIQPLSYSLAISIGLALENFN